MRKILASQLHIMVMRRDFLIALSVVLGFTLYSYLANVFGSVDQGFSEAYSWHFLYAGNANSNIWPVFSILFPFIVAVPFGFSYIQDRESGLLIQYIHRAGDNYYHAKLLASFIGSFAVVAIPFAVNLILCYSTFPHDYNAPVLYDQMLTGDRVSRATVFAAKPFAGLFMHSLLLYNLLYLAFLSLLSGLVGMFATAFSFLVHRRRLQIFIPLFIIFQAGIFIDGAVYDAESLRYFNTNILDYVGTDAFYGQSVVFACGFALAMTAFTLIACNRAIRREDAL
jgi:hypothetical protein